MPQPDTRQQTERSLLLQQGMAAVLAFLIIGVLLYGVRGASDATSRKGAPQIKRFSCPYAEMIRPLNWLGGMSGATFSFHNPEQTAHAVLHALRDDAWHLAAIDANPAALALAVDTALKAAELSLPDVKIADLQTDQPFHDLTALRFSLSAGDRQGVGVLFYARNVRYVYLGVWDPRDEHGERLAIACLDHVTLPKPYDVARYRRPVTDTRVRPDLARYLGEAESRLIEARATLDAGQRDMLGLQRAMVAIETAMKQVAIAQTHGAAFPRTNELVAICDDCCHLRESRMNLMKGQVIQYRALGNDDMAKAIAHDLIVACTLDSDLRVKAWAERQHQQLATGGTEE